MGVSAKAGAAAIAVNRMKLNRERNIGLIPSIKFTDD
jgi:hypothetical protein